MKKIAKIFSIILFVIFTQACSNDLFTDEQLTNLVSNVEYENIQKVEFDKNKNILNIFVFDEFINEEEAKEIIEKIKINKLSGLESFDKKNFDNKNFNITIISSNDNQVIIENDNVNNYKLNIIVNNHSKEYIEKYIAQFSKNIISFNDLVGRIEIDLKKNQKNEDRVMNIDTNYNSLLNNIEYLSKLLNDSSDDFQYVSDKLETIKILTSIIKNDVNLAVDNNNYYFIEKNYLNVNELDKIARELSFKYNNN